MTRDLAVPVLLGLLALAALPSTGLLATGGAHVSSAGAYLTFALLLTAAFALLLVPWLRNRGRGGALRIAVLALAAAPFLVYGVLATPAPPGAVLLPGWAVLLALAAGMVLAALPLRLAAGLGAGVLAFLGADALLGTAGLRILPARWVAGAGPVAVLGGTEEPGSWWTGDPRLALRAGAPYRTDETPLGQGPGPFWVPARDGAVAGERPFVLLLDGRAESKIVRAGTDGTFVPLPIGDLRATVGMDAFDAVLVLPGAWADEDPEGAQAAEAIASRTRRGGLLLGPAPGRVWPRPLGRLLGAAGQAEESGAEAVRAFGLGRVVRVGSEAEAMAILRDGLWRPAVRTAFDADRRAGRPPVPPALAARVRHEAPARGAQGALLLVYAVVAGVMDRILRGAAPRLLGVLGPALAVTAGLLWTAPDVPRLRAEGLRLELGGGGGRRIEAVLLEAGPGGWAGRLTFEGGGLVRLIDAEVDATGRVLLAPGRRAWAVRETLATGDRGALGRPADAPFVRSYVRGPPGADVRTGRIDRLPVAIEGLGPIGAWTLALR